MKRYIRIKNLIIALLVGFIYHNYIVPSVPFLTELFGLAYVCTMTLAILEYLDGRKKAKIEARRKERQEKKKSAPVSET